MHLQESFPKSDRFGPRILLRQRLCRHMDPSKGAPFRFFGFTAIYRFKTFAIPSKSHSRKCFQHCACRLLLCFSLLWQRFRYLQLSSSNLHSCRNGLNQSSKATERLKGVAVLEVRSGTDAQLTMSSKQEAFQNKWQCLVTMLTLTVCQPCTCLLFFLFILPFVLVFPQVFTESATQRRIPKDKTPKLFPSPAKNYGTSKYPKVGDPSCEHAFLPPVFLWLTCYDVGHVYHRVSWKRGG